MRVTSIIENTSVAGLPVEHGLSLYIQLDSGHNVLFDMGKSHLFVDNAQRLALSIADIDVAVISHGHYDHGGGLRTFLDINDKAKVYIRKNAFLPYYSLRSTGLVYIGLDDVLSGSDRLIFCDSIVRITVPSNNTSDETMTLFADVNGNFCFPIGNRLLFGPDMTVRDSFTHEQNLIIEEGDNVILFAGCAHNGIVNIMRRAEAVIGRPPTHVLAGMHLVKSGLSSEEDNAFITRLAGKLMEYGNTIYYTMHCTGLPQYEKLQSHMGSRIGYLSCGDTVYI